MELKTVYLHISNFVRPFTISQVKALIAETSSPVFFWMDTIKSQCYIELPSPEDAEATFQALQNRIWPEETGRALKVSFVPLSELPKQGEFPR